MTTTLQAIEVDGRTIWVEVEELRIAGDRPQARGGKFADTSASGPVDAAVQSVAKVDIESVLDTLIAPIHRALGKVRPEEVSIELSLGLKGEVGVFVAKGEGNASVKVTAKWKFPAKSA
jgi:Trypsin-co-occurring domain 1